MPPSASTEAWDGGASLRRPRALFVEHQTAAKGPARRLGTARTIRTSPVETATRAWPAPGRHLGRLERLRSVPGSRPEPPFGASCATPIGRTGTGRTGTGRAGPLDTSPGRLPYSAPTTEDRAMNGTSTRRSLGAENRRLVEAGARTTANGPGSPRTERPRRRHQQAPAPGGQRRHDPPPGHPRRRPGDAGGRLPAAR